MPKILQRVSAKFYLYYFMFKKITQTMAGANTCSAMEAETIQKTRLVRETIESGRFQIFEFYETN